MAVRTLGLQGFEGGELAFDGIVRAVGTGGSYETTELPSGSSSVRSYRLNTGTSQYVSQWHDGATDTATPLTPNGTRWAFGFQMRPENNDANNNEGYFGVSTSTTERITLSRVDTTGFVTLRVGGSVVATSTFVPTIGEFTRYIVDVDNDTGGYIKVYVAGDLSTPIIDYALPGAAMTNPNAFIFGDNSSVTHYVDDFWAIDLDGELDSVLNRYISVSVAPVAVTGAGNYAVWGNGAGGTGLYSAIDEIPPSDADLIDSDAVGEASTFTNGGTTEDLVYSLRLKARVTRTGTVAGANLKFRLRQSSTDLDLATMAAPGDGYCIKQTDVDGQGNDWTKARLASSELGVLSVT